MKDKKITFDDQPTIFFYKLPTTDDLGLTWEQIALDNMRICRMVDRVSKKKIEHLSKCTRLSHDSCIPYSHNK